MFWVVSSQICIGIPQLSGHQNNTINKEISEIGLCDIPNMPLNITSNSTAWVSPCLSVSHGRCCSSSCMFSITGSGFTKETATVSQMQVWEWLGKGWFYQSACLLVDLFSPWHTSARHMWFHTKCADMSRQGCNYLCTYKINSFPLNYPFVLILLCIFFSSSL